jgi:hypothetical protein
VPGTLANPGNGDHLGLDKRACRCSGFALTERITYKGVWLRKVPFANNGLEEMK